MSFSLTPPSHAQLIVDLAEEFESRRRQELAQHETKVRAMEQSIAARDRLLDLIGEAALGGDWGLHPYPDRILDTLMAFAFEAGRDNVMQTRRGLTE